MELGMIKEARPRRVVICDDSRTIRAMLEEAFATRPDFQVVGVANGAAAAVTLIKELVPDIVTIDLCMPYIDGTALLEMLLDTPRVCKIVVSDQTTKSAELAAKLKSLGASACIGKDLFGRNREKFFAELISTCKRHKILSTQRLPVAKDEKQLTRLAPDSESSHIIGFGYPVPADERVRLQTIARKGLANSLSERQFDLVTKYVAETTGYPMCLLNFIDSDTTWVKSAYGLEPANFPRSESFCSYTIGQYSTLSVKDATKDERFADFPSVVGPMHIRSYVGQQIISNDGTRIGALCIIDQVARSASRETIEHIKSMASILSEIINQKPNIETADTRAP